MAWVDPDGQDRAAPVRPPRRRSARRRSTTRRGGRRSAGPSEVESDEPHLVTGPLGTFLMYRYTPDAESSRARPSGAAAAARTACSGPTTKIPDLDLTVGNGLGHNSSYVPDCCATARADLVEDPGQRAAALRAPCSPATVDAVEPRAVHDLRRRRRLEHERAAAGARSGRTATSARTRRAPASVRPRPVAGGGDRRAGLRRPGRLVVAGRARTATATRSATCCCRGRRRRRRWTPGPGRPRRTGWPREPGQSGNPGTATPAMATTTRRRPAPPMPPRRPTPRTTAAASCSSPRSTSSPTPA